jgi:ADP-ribosylglycohydrolase
MSKPSNPDLYNWVDHTIWLEGADLATEYLQAVDEGRDLSSVEAECRRLLSTKGDRDSPSNFVLLGGKKDAAWLQKCLGMVDKIQTLPYRADFPWVEPDDFPSIRKACPRPVSVRPWRGSGKEFYERLHGGLAGRIAGCMLGKPVEGLMQEHIRNLAEVTGRWPLKKYFRLPTPAERRALVKRGQPKNGFLSPESRCLEETLDGSMPDDDINYTLIGHYVIKHFGAGFRPHQVGLAWFRLLPINATCTAERVAYRNLANGILPPQSATHRNPYREWIGAQIRADYYGFANPGDPQRAAEWAWRDASISHTRNGIYGEMWVAAMLAAAYTEKDWTTIIRAGLARIPKKSRLHAAVEETIAFHAAGHSFDAFVEKLCKEWNGGILHGWVHTIPNAQIVAAALLYGGDDYSSVVGMAVGAGMDTDCNGATAGGLWGVRYGYKAIPRYWLDPLNDLCRTHVGSATEIPISKLASDMVATALKAR